MRTLEEVREHLATVCYGNEEDKYAIIGFLVCKGLFEGKSGKIDFAFPEENTFEDFLKWFKGEEEDKYSFESWVDSVIKDAEKMKFNRFFLEDETKEVREELEQLNDEIKERGKKCIAEMDASLKELERQVNCTTDPILKKIGSCFLEFAKEFQKELEEKTNA